MAILDPPDQQARWDQRDLQELAELVRWDPSVQLDQLVFPDRKVCLGYPGRQEMQLMVQSVQRVFKVLLGLQGRWVRLDL